MERIFRQLQPFDHDEKSAYYFYCILFIIKKHFLNIFN